jgi:MFS family permease
MVVYRNMPEEHTKVSRAELTRIRGLDANGEIKRANVAKRPKVPWSILLKHGNMWAVMCAYAAYIYSLWFFLSWLPSYLVDYRHFTLLKTGLFASMPLAAGVVGDAFGGWLTDKLLVKTNNLKFSRRSVAIVAMLGCGTCTMFAALAVNPNTAVYCLTAAMFFLEMTIGPAWAVPMDIGGEFSGTVSGMMNMGGQFVGALSPTVFGYLVSRGSWVAPFSVSAGLLCLLDRSGTVGDRPGNRNDWSFDRSRAHARGLGESIGVEVFLGTKRGASLYSSGQRTIIGTYFQSEAGWPIRVLFKSPSVSTGPRLGGNPFWTGFAVSTKKIAMPSAWISCACNLDGRSECHWSEA